jgi:polyisoprenoid-binding protein YceI
MKKSTWSIDPTHSEIQFKVKHLMISTVSGQFNKFNGSIAMDGDDFSSATVDFTADVNSITTNNEQRDAHLKNGDFFDAENYPQLIFKGDKLEKVDDENYKLHGTLTMRGVSKRISIDAEFGGMTQDPWGNTRVGFSINTKINRKDFGISFGMVSETGGVMLGDEVKIIANTEFVKEALKQVA